MKNLSEKDAKEIASMISSETDEDAYKDFVSVSNSMKIEDDLRERPFRVKDFLYTLDYDVNVVVQKLRDDTHFFYYDNPYAEELQNKEVISSYVGKNENDEPVIHLVIDEEYDNGN